MVGTRRALPRDGRGAYPSLYLQPTRLEFADLNTALIGEMGVPFDMNEPGMMGLAKGKRHEEDTKRWPRR